MPPIFTPPLQGRVVKIHRMPGHYVGEGEPIVDLRLGYHILTLCAPFAGKVVRCRDVDDVVSAGDDVTEVTGVGKPTWELFIAYRRADAPGHAGRIGDGLFRRLGPGQVFKDVESLLLGQDFADVIREQLQRAFCMVVIIGPNWARDPRIHDPHDLHREEIRTALQRGIEIVPVRVNGAAIPMAEDLPEDIQPLVRKLAAEITDARWEYDVGVLADRVEGILARSPKRQRFLAQVPPWDHEGWQWITDDPGPDDLA